jgi:hypothetical protein
VLNIYGPYIDQILFWEGLSNCKVSQDPFTIVGGDLNLIHVPKGGLGEKVRRDHQSVFFSLFFEKHSLVDVELVKLVPTWRNFRVGDASI